MAEHWRPIQSIGDNIPKVQLEQNGKKIHTIEQTNKNAKANERQKKKANTKWNNWKKEPLNQRIKCMQM